MSYVMVVIANFTGTNAREVTLKVRRRAVTMIVDVAEITRRRFMKELDVGRITIGTKEILQEEGGSRNVLTSEITLGRG